MQVYENERYLESIRAATNHSLPWKKLHQKSVLIVGATGLIGRCLTDVLMQKNRKDGLHCHIYAVSRSKESMWEVFPADYFTDGDFTAIVHDVQEPFGQSTGLGTDKVDYVLHLASNTHPVAYATEPIDTIVTNIYGTQNLLDFSVRCGARRFVLLSSVEIYGENRGDVEKFDEEYVGYLNSNTLRAGYPESKRCAEALCQAYIAEKHIDAVISRLPRIYGPTMRKSDSKAVAQFIKKAAAGEDIILKSRGNQYYSYLYVVDAVIGILCVLLKGECAQAYNLADEGHNVTLKTLAELLAELSGGKVVYDIPDKTEREGYSMATKACLDSTKIRELGWKAAYNLEQGLRETLDVLQKCDDFAISKEFL